MPSPNLEDSPLLQQQDYDSRQRSEEEGEQQQESQQEPQSYAQLAASHWTTGVPAMLAQAGLGLFALTLAWILVVNPAGLFSYHPTAQLGAILCLAEGVLLLQPTRTPNQKAKGLDLHQAFQGVGVTLALIGVAVIFYNKRLHGAPHFTTWHGTCGIAAAALFVVQALVGVVVGRQPGQRVLGVNRAKSLWKWHRASGYLILVLLFATPLLATQSSTWMIEHSNGLQRAACAVALAIAWVGVTLRANPQKMKLWS